MGRNGCRDQSVRDSACRMKGCQVAVSNSVGRGGGRCVSGTNSVDAGTCAQGGSEGREDGDDQVDQPAVEVFL